MQNISSLESLSLHTLNGVLVRIPPPPSLHHFPMYIMSHNKRLIIIKIYFRQGIVKWETDTGSSLKTSYVMSQARDQQRRHYVNEYARTSVADCRLSLIEHKSADLASVIQAINGFVSCVCHSWCSFFSCLWHFFVLFHDIGPQNNDLTESGFGCFDYYRHRTIASFHAVMGVVLCNRMHLFASNEVPLPRSLYPCIFLILLLRCL